MTLTGSVSPANAGDVSGAAAVLPTIELAVGDTGAQPLVTLDGGVLAAGRFATLALRWPWPGEVAQRDVQLGLRRLRAGAATSRETAALVALAGESGSADESSALERATTLAQGDDSPAPPQAALPGGYPSIAEVQDATLAFAGLDPRRLEDLTGRARRAALLPELSMSLDRTVRRDDTVLFSPISGDRLDVLAGQGYAYQAHATWHLDRLVYDPAELRVAWSDARMSRERAGLLAQVTTLYFQRVRLSSQPASADPRERAIAIDELDAQIDALCGGCIRRARSRE